MQQNEYSWIEKCNASSAFERFLNKSGMNKTVFDDAIRVVHQAQPNFDLWNINKSASVLRFGCKPLTQVTGKVAGFFRIKGGMLNILFSKRYDRGEARILSLSNDIKKNEKAITEALEEQFDLFKNKGLCGQGNLPKDFPETEQENEADGNDVESPIFKTNDASNKILYGPPGTGKTYNTINEALAIVNPEYLAEYEHDRTKIKTRFDELVTKNRIGFVTFHQSFSYEDFVEGLKANSENGLLSYSVEPGVFKTICERASSSHSQVISVDAFENAVLQLQEKYEEVDDRIEMETVRGKKFEIEYVGGATFKIFPHSTENTDPKYVASIANVRKLYLTGSKQDIYNTSYVEGFLLYLKKHFGLKEYLPDAANHKLTQQPFVLIIDEINRGNISNIFGELITLVEPSKRAGCAEALSVKLPYSKESFSVPSNLHIIGTMNTADKSLAQVDIALRRRFEFVEMMPDHELLKKIGIDGIIDGIDVVKMLKTINQRIELLYDREHTIGHSFFLPLTDKSTIKDLARIFELEILPLLEEYFFEDWERVSQVLGDHLKNNASLKFIEEKFTDTSILQLMGNDWSQDGIRPYQRNNAALLNPEAYKGIYDSQQG